MHYVPMGCEVTAEVMEGKEIITTGHTCPRGREYVIQEMTNPLRNIASSVLVKGGELPLASVRLDRPVPRDRIFDVMAEIRKQKLTAPVKAGQVVIENVLGLGSNVITTKRVAVVGGEQSRRYK
ncbi:DUF1667 domain-containing protein [Clostridium sp. AM58-1XD]|uniref:DUF1667 domain-containing protein n=1 Tax=Clostridium sp. AM58-1XD TaxID=2292307 RepID=UPI0026C91606